MSNATPVRDLPALHDASTGAAVVDPDAPRHAEGFDADLELARHLAHDCGTITPFVEAVLPDQELARMRGSRS